MEGRRGDGWVREGDEAPLFELPDTEFKPVSPLRTATKVSHIRIPWVSRFKSTKDKTMQSHTSACPD